MLLTFVQGHSDFDSFTSPLELLGQLKQIFIRSLHGFEEQSLGSHDQDGRHACIWYKPFIIFFVTDWPMSLKFAIQHQVLSTTKFLQMMTIGQSSTFLCKVNFGSLRICFEKMLKWWITQKLL